MKKIVMFDLDGTLLNTIGDIAAGVNYALASVGMPQRSEAEVHGYINNGTRKLIERALGDKADERLIERCFEAYCEYYSENYCQNTRPYEGIVECVDKLIENGVICAVVTNKMEDVSKSLCDRFFPGRFSAVVGGREDSPNKPDPARVFYVLDKLGGDVKAFVGDSYVDVETAKNANMPCVALTWGFNTRERLGKAGAEMLADNADELWTYLSEILDI